MFGYFDETETETAAEFLECRNVFENTHRRTGSDCVRAHDDDRDYLLDTGRVGARIAAGFEILNGGAE
jgi:hypothetical protein